nr:hypothetical protein [Streptomyces sp. 846.5]
MDANEHLSAKPAFPWTRQSALRIGDAGVGLLAAELARHSGAPAAQFDAYVLAHRLVLHSDGRCRPRDPPVVAPAVGAWCREVCPGGVG